MNVSRARGFFRLLAAALPLLAAQAVLAQQPAAPGKPLILTSPNLEAPTEPAPAPKADTPRMEAPKAETPLFGKATGRFEVEELKAPDLEAVGVLDERQGGLGEGLWRGTPATTVRHLLPRLPGLPSSRTLRLLERRLLLTAAAAPEGNRGQLPPLLELRAERLYALGEVDGLAGLLKAAPATLSSPGLSRLKIDTFLLAGDAKAACAEAAIAAQAAPLDPRLSVFCQLSAGKVLEANMALDLMRERKDADHAFIAAAEAMSGTPPARIDRLPNPTPLHLAAFKAAKMPLPADAAAAAPPAMLKAIADNAGMAADLRLIAAERAEALGILDTETLRKMMAAVTLSAAEQQAAQTQGDKSPKGRALWLRAAATDAPANVRADLIGRILAAAEERHAFTATARLYAPLIADLKPAPDLAAFAPALARALYAAGRPEAAGGWLSLAKSDPAGAKAAAALWPLARLARPGAEASPPEALASWLATAGGNERRTAVALDLLQAVGEPVPAADWLPLATGTATSPGPKPALRAMLRNAAEGVHMGETVLLALAGLGETGLDAIDPDALNRVMVALRMVGLDREARDLGTEAALANGM